MINKRKSVLMLSSMLMALILNSSLDTICAQNNYIDSAGFTSILGISSSTNYGKWINLNGTQALAITNKGLQDIAKLFESDFLDIKFVEIKDNYVPVQSWQSFSTFDSRNPKNIDKNTVIYTRISSTSEEQYLLFYIVEDIGEITENCNLNFSVPDCEYVLNDGKEKVKFKLDNNDCYMWGNESLGSATSYCIKTSECMYTISDVDSGNYEATLTECGTTGFVQIPEKINGISVTSVKRGAFTNKCSVQFLHESGNLEIKSGAFNPGTNIYLYRDFYGLTNKDTERTNVFRIDTPVYFLGSSLNGESPSFIVDNETKKPISDSLSNVNYSIDTTKIGPKNDGTVSFAKGEKFINNLKFKYVVTPFKVVEWLDKNNYLMGDGDGVTFSYPYDGVPFIPKKIEYYEKDSSSIEKLDDLVVGTDFSVSYVNVDNTSEKDGLQSGTWIPTVYWRKENESEAVRPYLLTIIPKSISRSDCINPGDESNDSSEFNLPDTDISRSLTYHDIKKMLPLPTLKNGKLKSTDNQVLKGKWIYLDDFSPSDEGGSACDNKAEEHKIKSDYNGGGKDLKVIFNLDNGSFDARNFDISEFNGSDGFVVNYKFDPIKFVENVTIDDSDFEEITICYKDKISKIVNKILGASEKLKVLKGDNLVSGKWTVKEVKYLSNELIDSSGSLSISEERISEPVGTKIFIKLEFIGDSENSDVSLDKLVVCRLSPRNLSL